MVSLLLKLLLGLLLLVSSTTASSSSSSSYSRGSLPPILEFINGTQVTSISQVAARQQEIFKLLQTYFYGTFPSSSTTQQPPNLLTSTLLNSSTSRGYESQWINATYATPITISEIVFEVIRPLYCTAATPCPVSMMSKEHRRWNIIAAQRGYVAINIPAGDNSCTTSECTVGDATAQFAQNYPNATFQLIARRAYLCSRVVDYIYGSPPAVPITQVNFMRKSQIGLTGHSRNGKVSLIAGALDTRFTAIVDSSSGAAGISPYRCSGGEGQCERPGSSWPGPWFLPSLKSYDGFEHRLPVDSHSIVGLIAPRHLLLAHALNDAVIPTRCVEAAYADAMTIYSLLSQNTSSSSSSSYINNLRIDYRAGDHHGYESPHRYIDWYDVAFNYTNPQTCGNQCVEARKKQRKARYMQQIHDLLSHVDTDDGNDDVASFLSLRRMTESSSLSSSSTFAASPYDPSHWPQASILLHSFNWTEWSQLQPSYPSPPPAPGPNATSLDAVLWSLGIAPDLGPVFDPGGTYPPSSDLTYIDSLMLHDAQAGSTASTVVRNNIAFGGNIISGQMYYRKDMVISPFHSYPAVIWLHSADYNKGIQASYTTDSLDMMHAIANASFVVVSFDQLGFGMRLQEGTQFYSRFPSWSKLGAMVRDVQSALDVLCTNQSTAFHPAGEPDALPPYPTVDPSRIYVAGYSIGGAVALYTAALDERIAGVATISGWTPLRLDTDSSTSGGNRRWWEFHATQPRLGYYTGQESSQLPVEWTDVLSEIQPRPVHAYVPELDRLYDAQGVNALINSMRNTGYVNLTFSSPSGLVHSLDAVAREDMIQWLIHQAYT